ncbi:hypothetical protein HY837_06760 [archaeon]|nr:hypothetical protein [archaeon]
MNEQIAEIGRYTKKKVECNECVYTENENGFFFLEPGKSLEEALLFKEKDDDEENDDNDTEYPDDFVKKIMEYDTVKFYKTETEITVLHPGKNCIVSYDSFYDAEDAEDLLELIFEKKKKKKRHNPEITEEDRE